MPPTQKDNNNLERLNVPNATLEQIESVHAAYIFDHPELCSDVTNVNVTSARSERIPKPVTLREAECTSLMLVAFIPATDPETQFYRDEMCISTVRSWGLSLLDRKIIRTPFEVSHFKTTSSRVPPFEGLQHDQRTSRENELIARAKVLFNESSDVSERFGICYPESALEMLFLKISGARSIDNALLLRNIASTELLEFCISFLEIRICSDWGASFDTQDLLKSIEGKRSSAFKLACSKTPPTQSGCANLALTILKKGPAQIWDTTVQCRVFNKFAFALENRRAFRPIGLSLDRWIESGENSMFEAASRSLETGLTCIEHVFVFAKSGPVIPATAAIVQDALNFLYSHIGTSKILFRCPIDVQWRTFTESLTDSVVILDLINNVCTLGFWQNSETRQIGGATCELTSAQQKAPQKVINWMAGNYSFKNGICNMLVIDDQSGIPEFSLKKFRKSPENTTRQTFLIGSSTIYASGFWYPGPFYKDSDNSTTRTYIDPQSRGLSTQPNIEMATFMKHVTINTEPVETPVECSEAESGDDAGSIPTMFAPPSLGSRLSIMATLPLKILDPETSKNKISWVSLAKLEILTTKNAFIQSIRPRVFRGDTRYILEIERRSFASTTEINNQLNRSVSLDSTTPTFEDLKAAEWAIIYYSPDDKLIHIVQPTESSSFSSESDDFPDLSEFSDATDQSESEFDIASVASGLGALGIE